MIKNCENVSTNLSEKVYLLTVLNCCCWPWLCIVSVLPFVRLVSAGLSRRCIGEATRIFELHSIYFDITFKFIMPFILIF